MRLPEIAKLIANPKESDPEQYSKLSNQFSEMVPFASAEEWEEAMRILQRREHDIVASINKINAGLNN